MCTCVCIPCIQFEGLTGGTSVEDIKLNFTAPSREEERKDLTLTYGLSLMVVDRDFCKSGKSRVGWTQGL